MRRSSICAAVNLALASVLAACAAPGPSGGEKPDLAVQVPGSKGGNGFDDVRYSAAIGKVLLGAGSAGLALVDADTGVARAVTGINPYSADEGDGTVFAADRGTNEILAVDPVTLTVVSRYKLSTTPDYLRYLSARREVWVSLPAAHRIDVLSVSNASPPQLSLATSIDVGSGPEGIAFAEAQGRAYFHLFDGHLGVIDVQTRAITDRWSMGCSSVHGIPIADAARALVFAGCRSAEVVSISTTTGAVLDRFKAEGGATILGYSPALHHFYLRADPGVPVYVLGVGADGKFQRLGTADATMSGHCLTADDRGHFWVCDEDGGRLLRFADPFAATN